MGRYVDKDRWEEEILIPDTHTPILGGQPVWEGDRLIDGFSNVSPAMLADRTRHLKNKLDGIEIGLDTNFENFMKKDDNLSDLEDIQQAKYNLELNLVDNTRDLDKPISDATQEALDEKVDLTDPRLSDSRTPKGSAGGVLSGSYPNPTFSVDMATQAELNAVDAAKVDKVAGKGLSTEDFTSAEKNRLAELGNLDADMVAYGDGTVADKLDEIGSGGGGIGTPIVWLDGQGMFPGVPEGEGIPIGLLEPGTHYILDNRSNHLNGIIAHSDDEIEEIQSLFECMTGGSLDFKEIPIGSEFHFTLAGDPYETEVWWWGIWEDMGGPVGPGPV